MIGAGASQDLSMVRDHNMEAVKAVGAKTVVFSCPSCYRTWKEYYRTDLSLLHITELLANLIQEGRISLGEYRGTVTYHDPCDLGRHGGIFEAPRAILRNISGIELKEMEHTEAKSLCCGGGGNLEMVDPELSRRLAIKRIDEARAIGVKTLVTACQQCVRTIKGAARRERLDFHVMDITDVVIEAMK